MPVSDPSAQNPHSYDQATPMDKNSETDFSVRFWGVRGSIPTPGSQTVEYGGNTSCVEMRLGEKRLIFDAGTGLRVLGMDLLRQMPVEAYMFFPIPIGIISRDFPFSFPLLFQLIVFIFMGRSHRMVVPSKTVSVIRWCTQIFPSPSMSCSRI